MFSFISKLFSYLPVRTISYAGLLLATPLVRDLASWFKGIASLYRWSSIQPIC